MAAILTATLFAATAHSTASVVTTARVPLAGHNGEVYIYIT